MIIHICWYFDKEISENRGLKHGNKNTEIPSIKTSLNIARRNHYLDLDSQCILTKWWHGLYGVKKSFWINRNRSKWVFRLIDFPEFAISPESHWEC